jgi:putative endonuclease
MNIELLSTKDIGTIGEKVAAEYLQRKGFKFVEINFTRKTGEIDLIMRKDTVLHFVEVKSVICNEFPNRTMDSETFGPEANLHAYKIRKVIRTSEWFIAENGWEGEWQVDGALVWLRKRDRIGRVVYLPHIG